MDETTSDRKWLVLVIVAIAQLMVVLDVTIVNIALPRAQVALHFANSDRQWVITAYALTFGGLLLLGGRLGDLFGRKGAFLIGLAGFAGASALGGAAPDFAVLAAARALQGAFGAILAPAALGTLANTFQDPRERGKAFAVFGAVAGGGSAVGLVLGGVLTEYLSWRYCLYVNLIFAVVAGIGASALLRNDTREGSRPRLDLPGTVLAILGLFGVVYGFSHAETAGWSNTTTLASLGVGAVLLITFVVTESRVRHPLLPLRVVTQRTRGGSFIAVLVASVAIFALFLFLTFYLQTIAGFSPVRTGLAFLPFTAAILTASTTSNTVLLHRTGARPLIATGMILGTVAMLGLTQLDPHSSYVGHVLPELVVLGLGFGLIITPAINMATTGVRPTDAGVASAMVNTMQQVGGSIGTALLSTVAADATVRALRHAPTARVAATLHGYHIAFFMAGATFAGGALVCGALLESKRAVERRAIAAHPPVEEGPAPARVDEPTPVPATPVVNGSATAPPAPPAPPEPAAPPTPAATHEPAMAAMLARQHLGHGAAPTDGGYERPTGDNGTSTNGTSTNGTSINGTSINGNSAPTTGAAAHDTATDGDRPVPAEPSKDDDQVELTVTVAVRWSSNRS